MDTCKQCGGLLIPPGISYNYSGPVCLCSRRILVTPMPQAEIDEALVLAMEADKRELERLRAVVSAYPANLTRLEIEIESLRDELADANRNNELLASEIEQTRSALIASQARETVLREWLISLDASAIDDDTHYYYFSLRDPESLDDLLALPADDTALEQTIAKAQEEMRERCIEEVRGVGGIDAIEVERLIRALEVKP